MLKVLKLYCAIFCVSTFCPSSILCLSFIFSHLSISFTSFPSCHLFGSSRLCASFISSTFCASFRSEKLQILIDWQHFIVRLILRKKSFGRFSLNLFQSYLNRETPLVFVFPFWDQAFPLYFQIFIISSLFCVFTLCCPFSIFSLFSPSFLCDLSYHVCTSSFYCH